MDKKTNNASNHSDTRDMTVNTTEQQSSVPNDLPDSKRDKERLQTEETTINLPDVEDIPGQENVKPAPFGEMGDTTIASDDEEGASIFDNDNDDANIKIVTGAAGDVNLNERRALDDDDYMPTTDEDNLRNATMDNTDFQGDALNEESFGEERSGRVMHTPGEKATANDPINQQYKENNDYQVGSGENEPSVNDNE